MEAPVGAGSLGSAAVWALCHVETDIGVFAVGPKGCAVLSGPLGFSCPFRSVELLGFQVRLSAKRGAWLVNWFEVRVAEGFVDMEDFATVVGRVGFALSVLDHLRPSAAPLYSWCTAVEYRGLMVLPWPVAFLLTYLPKNFVDKAAWWTSPRRVLILQRRSERTRRPWVL